MLTCLCCHISFQTFEAQRTHFKTQWHNFNLKRKSLDLMPLTFAVFSSRNQVELESVFKPKVCCGKLFSSQGSLSSHQASLKHRNFKERPLSDTDDSTTETISELHPPVLSNREDLKNIKLLKSKLVEATTQEELDLLITSLQEKTRITLLLTDCLFCQHSSQSIEDSLSHMKSNHGFFVIQQDLVDLNGFLSLLAQKITTFHLCLYCNGKGKSFDSVDAVRKHMIEKGHCKITDSEEYEQFYNQEWDDVEDGEEYWDGAQLVMSNGLKLGHRDYARYWKQNLHSRVTVTNPSKRLIMFGTRNGGMKGTVASRSDLGLLKKQAIAQQRHENNDRMKIGIKANALQKHYRHQNPL